MAEYTVAAILMSNKGILRIREDFRAERGKHVDWHARYPEVSPGDSPLYDLPNVLLTPHVAGPLGNEMERLLDMALAELGRYAQGLEFEHPVLRRDMDVSA